MSIFDINYNNKSIEWLSPDKRLPKLTGFVQGLLSPVQWLRDKFLGDYRTGGNYQQWIFTHAYALGALVVFKQTVYISLKDDNIDAPTYAPSWAIYLRCFLGVDERILFNGQRLVLEYALNQYFYYTKPNHPTNFRQPGLLGYYYPADTPGTPTSADADHTLHSDIFTLNNAFETVGFLIGTTEPYTSSIAANDIKSGDIPDWSESPYLYNGEDNPKVVVYNNYLYQLLANATASDIPGEQPTIWHQVQTIGYNSPFLDGDNFTIYFPSAVYALTNESEVREFVNKIIPAGIIYSIATY